jgi:hypothetical protein
MKSIVKIFKVAALAAVILFLMVTCDTGVDDDDNGPAHYDGTLMISNQQVWEQNREATKQSDDWYYKFEEDKSINVFAVFSYDAEERITSTYQLAGSGKIDKGLLSFEAGVLSSENLVNAGTLFPIASFKEYADIKVSPPETMGNIILPVTTTGERLNREGLFLLHSSVGLESIQYIYVDRDCQVTGNPDIITWVQESLSYISRTESSIDLSLKKGWNTICRMEVFDSSSGYDNVSMGIKNPNNFKWVIYTRQ